MWSPCLILHIRTSLDRVSIELILRIKDTEALKISVATICPYTFPFELIGGCNIFKHLGIDFIRARTAFPWAPADFPLVRIVSHVHASANHWQGLWNYYDWFLPVKTHPRLGFKRSIAPVQVLGYYESKENWSSVRKEEGVNCCWLSSQKGCQSHTLTRSLI